MKHFLRFSTFLFLFSGILLNAQEYPGCDGMRYRNDVFTEVSSTLGLMFGSGTTIAGNSQDLFLDVYEPVGDVQEARPVIIMAFGGSFISGERGDMASICEAYARKGYVAVSIDYRLYDLPLVPFPTGNEMKEVVVKAISDYKAAIRFMREDAATGNQFRIDSEMIFIGGVSAGAIAAAHTAVLDETDEIEPFLLDLIEANGGFEGNTSTNTEYSSEVQGYINMSGGLNDASWMDAGDPPFVSIHDDMDIVVPYNTGFATILSIQIVYLEGSRQLHLKGDSLEIMNDLLTIEESFGHVSYLGTAADFTANIDFTASFVHDVMCGEIVNTEEVSEALSAVQLYPNPVSDRLFLKNPNNLNLNLSLYNGLGQLVKQESNANELFVSDLSAGMYLLQIEDQDTREKMTRKLIVR